MNNLFEWSTEAAAARDAGRPMVALESTIISHGLPYPTNVDVGKRIEQTVHDGGAVPATIAIRDGRIRIGLDAEQIEFFGHAQGVHKVSRRDIAPLLARGGNGATTVAATMLLAERAGIALFATGGIGGVHRGGAETLDISADLTELATSAVAVVCAGAKSILDIGLTLERLETLGVPVIGYQTDRFPAFYSRESGFAVPATCNSPSEVAEAMVIHKQLRAGGGMLIVNPVPADNEIPLSEMEPIITQAERERIERGVIGSEATPFLLARIGELTDGASIATNKALVYSNALLAAQVAVALGETDGR